MAKKTAVKITDEAKEKERVYSQQIRPLIKQLQKLCSDNEISMVNALAWNKNDDRSQHWNSVVLFDDSPGLLWMAEMCLEEKFTGLKKMLDVIDRRGRSDSGFVAGPLDSQQLTCGSVAGAEKDEYVRVY